MTVHFNEFLSLYSSIDSETERSVWRQKQVLLPKNFSMWRQHTSGRTNTHMPQYEWVRMWQNKHSQRQVATIRVSLILNAKKTNSEFDQFKYLSHHNIYIHFVDQDAYQQSGVKCHKLISLIRVLCYTVDDSHTVKQLTYSPSISLRRHSALTVNPNQMECNF